MKQVKLKFTLIILVLTYTSCNVRPNQSTLENLKPTNSREAILDMIINVHDNEQIEFLDIYSEVTVLLPDSTEKLILSEYLKEKGFTVTNWGRGNWTDGPRIVSQELTSEKCNCQVDKLYYFIDGYVDKYKVTERIKCN